jgi:hypothetical protein
MLCGEGETPKTIGSTDGVMWFHRPHASDSVMTVIRFSQVFLLVLCTVNPIALRAHGLVSALGPDLQYQAVVERMCVQGFALTLYRLTGRMNISRAMSKVASSIPEGSLSEIDTNYMLAHWDNAGSLGLIGLWAASESLVEGFYSILTNETGTTSQATAATCHGAQRPPTSLIEWISASMGLREIFSTVDYARTVPTYSMVYSSWLTSATLAVAVSRALKSAGWLVDSERMAAKSTRYAHSLIATKALSQLSLKILDAHGHTILFIISQ